MKHITLISAVVLAASMTANAKSKKIDWSLCEQEITSHCEKAKSDHEKHECLEKLPKGKLSDECRDKNEKLEGTFGADHHDHK